MNRLTRSALAAGAAVTLLAGASTLTVSAAPLALHADSLKASVPAGATDVRWRGRRGAIALGAFGVGVIAGSVIANSNRGYYAPQPYGYYSQPYGYYDEPYGYAPAPYAYSYGHRRAAPFQDPNGGTY